jgi:hypothetical protein
MVAGFDAEFVVIASQVLDERVTEDHDRCGRIRSQTSHRPQPRLKSSVVALDAVVPILSGVVEHVGEKFVDDAQQRCGQIRGDPGGSWARPGGSGGRCDLERETVDEDGVAEDVEKVAAVADVVCSIGASLACPKWSARWATRWNPDSPTNAFGAADRIRIGRERSQTVATDTSASTG